MILDLLCAVPCVTGIERRRCLAVDARRGCYNYVVLTRAQREEID